MKDPIGRTHPLHQPDADRWRRAGPIAGSGHSPCGAWWQGSSLPTG